MNQRLITIILSGFMGGVLFRSFVPAGGGPASGWDWAFPVFFAFLGAVLVLLSFWAKNRQIFALSALLLIAISFGIIRYDIKDNQTDLSFFENKINSSVKVEGIVVDEPDEREKYTRLVVESSEVKILVYANHYPEFQYGDKVTVSGVLKKPNNFSDDFDWVSYLEKDEIYFEIFYPEIELISSGNGNWIKQNLFLLKNKFLDSLSLVIPEPHSSFMGGLTVGAKQSIPKDLQEDFRKTGIIHIVVLSGYNITLVADTIMRFFSFLPGIFGISLGMLSIALFAIMTGASATIVRASIMAILVLLARATGRVNEITWALFLTAFLMIMHNPKILYFDVGFQLSFLATLALIWVAPHVKDKMQFIPKKFQLREIASATVATQIFVLPFLLYKMGLFSVVSLPVNLLVLIFVPMTMFFGFITGGLGMISAALSVPFGWISYVFLQYELWVVDFFANLPLASFLVEKFSFVWVILVYILYGLIIYKFKMLAMRKPTKGSAKAGVLGGKASRDTLA